MVDLDIPTPTPGVTTTLLHWLQTNLTSSRKPTTICGTDVYLLRNTTQTEPLAGYIAPQPPAIIPLSHTYVLILIDISDITPEGLDVLAKAADERVGFQTKAVLDEVGVDCVVAGTYFNVTNPGPTTGSTAPLPTGLYVRARILWKITGVRGVCASGLLSVCGECFLGYLKTGVFP